MRLSKTRQMKQTGVGLSCNSTLSYSSSSLLFSHTVVSDCDPMDFSTPGLTAPHYLPEFAQVHVHCINDVIQPSHPLMPSSALNVSQHQGFFQ